MLLSLSLQLRHRIQAIGLEFRRTLLGDILTAIVCFGGVLGFFSFCGLCKKTEMEGTTILRFYRVLAIATIVLIILGCLAKLINNRNPQFQDSVCTTLNGQIISFIKLPKKTLMIIKANNDVIICSIHHFFLTTKEKRDLHQHLKKTEMAQKTFISCYGIYYPKDKYLDIHNHSFFIVKIPSRQIEKSGNS